MSWRRSALISLRYSRSVVVVSTSEVAPDACAGIGGTAALTGCAEAARAAAAERRAMVFRMGWIFGARPPAGHPPEGWNRPPPKVCAAAGVSVHMRRAPIVLACLAGTLATAAPAMADSKMSVAGGVLYFRTEDAG